MHIRFDNAFSENRLTDLPPGRDLSTAADCPIPSACRALRGGQFVSHSLQHSEVSMTPMQAVVRAMIDRVRQQERKCATVVFGKEECTEDEEIMLITSRMNSPCAQVTLIRFLPGIFASTEEVSNEVFRIGGSVEDVQPYLDALLQMENWVQDPGNENDDPWNREYVRTSFAEA